MKKYFSPNAITIARIVLIPFGVYAIFKNGGDDSTWQIIAWCIYFVLGMSDLLDGHLARATNQVSELGKFLDPVADKALIGSAMISLSILGMKHLDFVANLFFSILKDIFYGHTYLSRYIYKD